MNNPLLETTGLPSFTRILAEHVEPAMESLLRESREVVERIKSEQANTWQTLVQPLENLDDRLSQAFSPISHLNAVMNSSEMREAYNSVLPLITAFQTEVSQDEVLYRCCRELAESDEFDGLEQPQRQVVNHLLRDFTLAGVSLDDGQRSRFAEIDRRLAELSSRFSDNVLDATMGWTKQVEDPAELTGLPQTALDMLRQNAVQRDLPGYVVTLEMPSYQAVMTYCDQREFRREVYEAFVTRSSDQGPQAGQWDNSAVMEEILTLRREKAGLLEFECYGDLSLVPKMAKSREQVLTFLEDLLTHSRPAAQSEYETLEEFARDSVDELAPWDLAYFSEKLKMSTFDFSEEETRPYFPAPRVISGMFGIVQRLFDVECREVSSLETWHPDVTTYELLREGKTIACFYLDLYAREHKRGGAWMADCRNRRVLDTGELQLPAAFLTCNFSSPVGDQPALLTHREVVTLFHEFGHGLHHMLTRVDCAAVSGINGVQWDAVELPSQFMENWCWEREGLSMISGHVDTDEPLPADLLDKMLAAKNFQAAMQMVRQLEFALFDFRLHCEFDGTDKHQIQKILDDVREHVAVVPNVPINRFQHGFSHIFGGGYAAGYYSYKWAEVLSADAFARFREQGVFDRQIGEQFLEAVLERGGSEDAMDLFVRFRGREPEGEALLRQYGIING